MADRLRAAVQTLAQLPRSGATSPAGVRSAWPDMIRKSLFNIEKKRAEHHLSGRRQRRLTISIILPG